MTGKNAVDDANAVARCLRGETDAFGVLVERYQALAVAVAFSICRERTLAEDVAQDAFVRAFRYLKQLARPESFCSWFLNIVRNVALRAAHNASRRSEIHRLAAADRTPHTRNPTASMEFWELLARVDDESRRVLTLKYLHGMTCAEVADELGVPLGTITSKISRALGTLREVVQREKRRWDAARDSGN